MKTPSCDEAVAKQLAELEARTRNVERREQALAARGLRNNLYARVTLSLRTLDTIILTCAALIGALVIYSIVTR